MYNQVADGMLAVHDKVSTIISVLMNRFKRPTINLDCLNCQCFTDSGFMSICCVSSECRVGSRLSKEPLLCGDCFCLLFGVRNMNDHSIGSILSLQPAKSPSLFYLQPSGPPGPPFSKYPTHNTKKLKYLSRN